MNRGITVKLFSFFLLVFSWDVQAQSADESAIHEVFDHALAHGRSYEMLKELCTGIGPRLSGSKGAADAVTWSRETMKSFGFDSVWLQPVMVPHWVRGQNEQGRILIEKKSVPVNITALGGSVGTGPAGRTARVVEVKSLEEVKAIGKKGIQGKIVFFNRPMDSRYINTFDAYSAAVDQRAKGASEAARLGAIAVIVRSMGSNTDEYPHTGGLQYATDAPQVPAVAISTKHADELSALLKQHGKDLTFYMETHCELLPDVSSFNVIGEMKGSEYPEEIILVGGHLDSWDLAQGAHDDGAGCIQSIEVLRIFKAIGYRPKRTIRAVMFMNEENGLKGGLKYAELALLNKEKHIAAIESDRGGFTPRGFTITGTVAERERIQSWEPLLEKYGLTDFDHQGGGADIEPLASQGTVVMEFLPDSQRYFDYHHTGADTLDKVSKRELEMGAASITALVWLLDKYGLK